MSSIALPSKIAWRIAEPAQGAGVVSGHVGMFRMRAGLERFAGLAVVFAQRILLLRMKSQCSSQKPLLLWATVMVLGHCQPVSLFFRLHCLDVGNGDGDRVCRRRLRWRSGDDPIAASSSLEELSTTTLVVLRGRVSASSSEQASEQSPSSEQASSQSLNTIAEVG